VNLDEFNPSKLFAGCHVLIGGKLRRVEKVQPVAVRNGDTLEPWTAVTFAETDGEPSRQRAYGPLAIVKGTAA
jgi:hypothetical protein